MLKWFVRAVLSGGHYVNALKLRLLLGESRDDVTSARVRAQYAGLVANLGLPGVASGDFVRAPRQPSSDRRESGSRKA